MGFHTDKNTIFLQLMIAGKRIKVSTGFTTQAWNKKKQRVNSSEDFAWEVNQALDKIQDLVEDLKAKHRVEGFVPDAGFLNNLVAEVTKKDLILIPEEKKRVWEYVDIYIQRKKEMLSEGYLKNWPSLREQLKEFAPLLTFDQLSPAWQQSFVAWMITEKEIFNNTLVNKIKYIQIMARDAQKLGYSIHPDFDGFSMKEVRYPVVWLDWDTHVQRLREVKLIKMLDQIRDRFLFRCNTGMREGEMNQLAPSHFYKKEGNTWLKYFDHKAKKGKTIVLNVEALALSEKYGMKWPKVVQSDENQLIKQVCMIAELDEVRIKLRHIGNKAVTTSIPLYDLITTHTARRTFARRWYEQGGNLLKLSRYLGHSSVDITQRYIGVEDEEANDEMLRVMG